MVKSRRNRRKRRKRGGSEEPVPCVHPAQADPCSTCVPPNVWTYNQHAPNEANCINAWQHIGAGIGSANECRQEYNCNANNNLQAGGNGKKKPALKRSSSAKLLAMEEGRTIPKKPSFKRTTTAQLAHMEKGIADLENVQSTLKGGRKRKRTKRRKTRRRRKSRRRTRRRRRSRRRRR